jgi:hypothetical protein
MTRKGTYSSLVVNDHEENDWQVVGLSHLLEQVRSLNGLPVVPAGFLGERTVEKAEWSLQPFSA